MVGYSKWVQIKCKKGVNDKKCSVMYFKYICVIQVVVCLGGSGDLVGNFSLKNVIVVVKIDMVFVDNIENVIKCVVGVGEGVVEYKEQIYEGYGFGGIVIFIEMLIDNVNCIVVDICVVFNKCGGSMGNFGLVVWQFEKKGIILFCDVFEVVQEVVIENGVEDIQEFDEGLEISIVLNDFYVVQDVLSVVGYVVESGQIIMLLINMVVVVGDDVCKLLMLVEYFEEFDDVQNVYINVDLFEDEED